MNYLDDNRLLNCSVGKQGCGKNASALTPMQHGMLMATLADPGSGVYVQQLCCKLREKLNVVAFRRAWQTLVERHTVLRTCFHFDPQGEPFQQVLDDFQVPLNEEDWRHLKRNEQELRLQEYLQGDLRRGFEFAQGPPIRLALFCTGQAAYRFVWTSHHALFDGRSRLLVLKELFAIYESFCKGGDFQSAERVPYRVYVDWLNAADFSSAEAYWRGKLADFAAPTQLNLDRMTKEEGDPVERFGKKSIRLSQVVTADLRHLGVAHQVTLNNVLQGAWAILLSRYSGEEDVVFGVTRACRRSGPADTESMVGLLINTLPMRVRIAPRQSLSIWLKQLRQEWMAMRDYEHTPLAKVHEWSDAPGGTTLFESIVVFEKYDLQTTLCCQEGNWTNREFQLHQRSNYPLTVAAYDGRELVLEIGFDRNRFDDDAIDRLLGNLQTLLVDMSRGEVRQVSDLTAMSSDERQQLIVTWNDTQSKFPSAACIHELFEAQVERTPDAVAVVFKSERVTYRELNARANQLAWHLRSLGVGPESIIGVCVQRSLEMIVGLLGTLKAGGSYLPLDAADPKERLEFVLRDAKPHLLLTQQSTQSRLPDRRVPQVYLDTHWNQIGKQCRENLAVDVTPENLAYVMYTSGSTGQPKAVAIRHRGVSRLLFGVDYARLDSQLRIIQMAPLSFDASTFEIWGPLLHGGQCIVFPDQIATMKPLGECIRNHRVNTLWLTSSLFNAVMDESPEIVTGIKQLLVGGEALSVDHIRRAVKSLPHTQIINGYGPTENTTFSSCYRIPVTLCNATTSIPIGRPIGNTTVYVLGPNMQPVPIGATGELYLGGNGLARGYVNRPDLTAERFLPHPFSDTPGDRLYRTGDLVRWLPDGNLLFVGRSDDQVKLRGFRIELGEIEAVLRSHPRVQTALALMWEDTPQNKQLVAYFVPDVGSGPSPQALQRYAMQKLPRYMIPTALVMLERLPLTPNGKLDRRSLPAPFGKRLDFQEAQPHSPTEGLLAGIWSDVLGTDSIGVDDNFFEIGGNSLTAMQVVARIQRKLDVDLPVSCLFESPTVAALAERISTGRRARTEHTLGAIARLSDDQVPLSFAQQRIWFLDQLFPDGSTYNIAFAIRFNGTLNVVALEQSIHEIIQRHEILRTTFANDNGSPYQVILQRGQTKLDMVDLRHLTKASRQSEWQRLASVEAKRPFDLQRGPLLRTTLLRLSRKQHVLLLTVHHIVFDGWSLNIFFNELAQLYTSFTAGKPSPLGGLPFQYGDYARWQRGHLRSEVLDEQVSYWKKQLAGAPQALDLPTDHPRFAIQSNHGTRHRLSFSEELMAALENLCHQEEVTYFMTMLAAFNVLLSRQCGQTDIVVGTPVAGRQQFETEDLIGMFVNTLALRTDLSDNPTFQELLRRVKEVALAAYENQDVPFERLVEELKPPRDLSRPPLVQVLINVFNFETLCLVLPDLQSEWLRNEEPESKFDLLLRVSKTAKGWSVMLDYNTDLFEASTIARMAADFEMILQAVSANPKKRLSELPVLTDSSMTHVTGESIETLPDPTVILEEPTFAPATRLISDWANRTPQQPAVCQDGRQWTYEELMARANSLASHLIADGQRPGEVVAVTGPKSFGLVVSMVGLLRSGAVILPIDPDLPQERQRVMIDEATARKTFCIQHEDVPQGAAARETVLISAEDGRLIHAAANPARQNVAIPDVDPNDAAYIFFTSGSTGKPKGILGCHKGLSHFLHWQCNQFAIGPRDRVAQLTTLSFDVVLRDIFLPLTSGATVCLPPMAGRFEFDDVLPWLERERITVLHTVPSLAELWLSRQQTKVDLTEMRWVFFAGEPLTGELVARWRITCSDYGKIVNLYGPTETTMAKCWYQVPEDVTPGVQSIGQSLPHSQAFVLNDERQPCDLGETGEIVLRTPFRTLGYLNSAENRHQGFVSNPFRNDNRDMLYFTGDRGRYRADGLLEFLGRIDEQVKIRGVRVEPPEVSAVLKQHPNVQTCFVTATKDSKGQNVLVAYVVAMNHDDNTVGEFRSFLGARLLAAMVPSKFVFLDRLPLTTSGKVDRQALLSPEQAVRETGQTSIEPKSSVEEKLVAIWREVLGKEQIARRDDFFELGGHSLLALQLISRIRKAFNIDLQLRRLFEAPTLGSLANVIEIASQQALKPTGRITHPEANERPASSESIECCIHQQFEIQAKRTPDGVAVVFEDGQLTYQDLNERSNQLARYLRTLGVGPDVHVGLCMERSPEMMVALLATLKAGGAYVPLDPSAPQDRLRYLLDDANVAVLITLKRHASELPASDARVVYVDTQWSVVAQQSAEDLALHSTTKNAAYVIYTSGSTGQPKGVVVEHRQVTNYVQGVIERAGWQSPLSFAMVQPLFVDSSVTSIYPPLFTGGTLHVISEERSADSELLGEYYDRFPIDCVKIAPTHLAALQMSPSPQSMLPRQTLILGGEASLWHRVDQLRAMAPQGCTIFNHYGPTEATVGVLMYRLEESSAEQRPKLVPIGQPLANTRVYILDDQLRPVLDGEVGELYLGGECVARGYLNRPELTAERFVPDALSGDPGSRMYKSGDLARRRYDGNIEFLGRVDDQIKIHGFRIEPGEIESVLVLHPAVQESLVIAREDEQGNAQLVAYLACTAQAAPSNSELRSLLREKLPAYMVPATFVVLDALPRTNHGKVDRRELPAPESTRANQESVTAPPTTDLEKTIASIWCELLNLEAVGGEDNFFELGGHSLVAMQVIARIRQVTGIRLPVRALFERQTIAELAQYIVENESSLAGEEVVSPQTHGIPRRVERDGNPLSFVQQRVSTDATIVHLFEAQVARSPDKMAVMFGEEQITYRELNRRANRVAHELAKGGASPESLVGIYLDRSMEMIVGVLGILKAGAAYVPLDPAYPPARLKYVLDDAEVPIVVTRQAQNSRLPEFGGHVLCLDRDISADRRHSENPVCGVDADNLAYVIYTSGSTGNPKGVLIQHRSVVNYLLAMQERLAANDTLLAVSTLAFDISALELLLPLIVGAKVAIVDGETAMDGIRLDKELKRTSATAMQATSATWHLLLEAGWQGNPDLKILCGGEALTPDLAEKLRVRGQSVTNLYGPTETTIYSTLADIELIENPIPIGRPIANTQVYVLDERRRPVPIGVTGELYIGGAGLARGYLNRPELTAEKFVPNPLSDDPGARVYRTGDLCRWREDGLLEFLGRIDDQVKLRGFRIELGEIEAVLGDYPAVRQCVVILREDRPGDKRLVGYYALENGSPASFTELTDHLRSRLPDYMVPSALVEMDAFPLTPSGKINRRGMPAPDESRPELAVRYVAPRNPTEEQLTDIWSQLLGIDEIGIHDNFFELGGHSLVAIQVMSRIRAKFQIDFPLRVLFEAPTVSGLAKVIETFPQQDPSPALTAVSAEVTPPLDSTGNDSPTNDQTLPTTLGSTVRRPGRTTANSTEFLRIEHRPLLSLFAMGKLAPVDAVAFGYLPDVFHFRAEANREEIREAWCEGLPTWARVIETFLGRIAIVRLPWYGSELYDDRTNLVAGVCDALDLAGRIGARAASLTGLIPSATEYGHAIASAASSRPDLPVVTTGHATTVATVVLTIKRALEETGRELTWEHVGFLGLGSIGLATLRLMLQCLPHPDRITLCDLYSNLATLKDLQRELVEQRGYRGHVRIIESRGGAPADFYDTTFIVGATNVPEVLDVNRLRPGAIIVDDSGPHCFSIKDAIRRFQEQQDIVCTAGGVLRSPQPNRIITHHPRRAEELLPRELKDQLLNYNPYHITGCVFSSLLTARFDEVQPTLGIVDDHAALEFYKLVSQLGYQAAELHCGPFFPANEAIAAFRSRFGATNRRHIRSFGTDSPSGKTSDMRQVARIEERWDPSIEPDQSLPASAIDNFAKTSRAPSVAASNSPLVGIWTAGSRRPFFCVHPGAGHVLCYGPLSRRLGRDQPFYGIEHPGHNGQRASFIRIEDLATQYIRAVRARQPEGPYLLGGWSMGGVVAFEMAQQLQLQGEQTDVLVLLESSMSMNKHLNPIDARVASVRNFVRTLAITSDDLAVHLPNIDDLELDKQLQSVLELARKANTVPGNCDLDDLRHRYQVFAANARAVRCYVPQPYAGRILVYQAMKSSETRRRDELAGWARMAEGGLTPHLVPGDHYTLLSEPHVQVLAEHLRNQLLNV